LSCNKDFAVVHNGIISNYMEIKKWLIGEGHKFHSETDTEVIVRLIEDKAKKSANLKEALRQAFLELKGRKIQ